MTSSTAKKDALNQITRQCENWEKDKDLFIKANEAQSELLALNLLTVLGIGQEKIFPQYKCSRTSKVDLAARFKALEGSSKFSKPDLIIEIKKPSVIFAEGEKRYAQTVSQLQAYLAAEKCKSVKYGIIFNGCQVQLFRKHGMLSYPISSILSLDKRNINGTISYLEKNIKKDEEIRGSIITVWNNKGGVGKTTIAQALAVLLSDKILYGKKEKNRILLIDYDHNQGDLTANCKMERSDGETKRLLEDEFLGKLSKESIINSLPTFTNIPERGTRPRFPFEIKILKADSKLSEEGPDYIKNFAAEDRLPLRKLCLQLSELFDYIFIDAPPNYEQSIFSKEAVSAADCILPIALFQNNNSIRNYAKAVIEHLKPAQGSRDDGGPFSLGIWFNRWRTTWTASPTEKSVERQIENTDQEEDQMELKRIFYKPNTSQLRKIDENADIARSIMDAKGLPGVVRYLKARNAFNSLVKEFSD